MDEHVLLHSSHSMCIPSLVTVTPGIRNDNVLLCPAYILPQMAVTAWKIVWGNCVHTPGAGTFPKIQNVQSSHQILWPCTVKTAHKALTEETLVLAEPYYKIEVSAMFTHKGD